MNYRPNHHYDYHFKEENHGEIERPTYSPSKPYRNDQYWVTLDYDFLCADIFCYFLGDKYHISLFIGLKEKDLLDFLGCEVQVYLESRQRKQFKRRVEPIWGYFKASSLRMTSSIKFLSQTQCLRLFNILMWPTRYPHLMFLLHRHDRKIL